MRPPLATPFNSASGHRLPMALFISYWKPSWEEFLSRRPSLLLTFLFGLTPHRLFCSPLLIGSPVLPAECPHSFSTLSGHLASPYKFFTPKLRSQELIPHFGEFSLILFWLAQSNLPSHGRWGYRGTGDILTILSKEGLPSWPVQPLPPN